MSQLDKCVLAILAGTNDNNIRFTELCKILNAIGFSIDASWETIIWSRMQAVKGGNNAVFSKLYFKNTHLVIE